MRKRGKIRNALIVLITLILIIGAGYWWQETGGLLDGATSTAATSTNKVVQKTRLNKGFSPVPYTITPITSQMSVEQITADFKKDEAVLEDLATTLISITMDNPDNTCAAIIAHRSSHNHAYYIFLAKLNALQAKYGSYRGSIDLINDTLKEKYEVRKIILAKCSSVGYRI